MTAQTNAEKQRAFRAKRDALGLAEVRGIYLPKDLHPALKALARKLLVAQVKTAIKSIK